MGVVSLRSGARRDRFLGAVLAAVLAVPVVGIAAGPVAAADPPTPVLVVGGGECPSGYGDGGPATEATLVAPTGVASAPLGSPDAGAFYVADSADLRVRRIGPEGTIATVAGTGEEGFSGDGGPGVSAKISYPRDVAVGPDGSVYVATADARVRRIGPDGTISTFAGTGEPGFSGDGASAVAAKIGSDPAAVAADASGNVYIADTENYRVRRVAVDGTISTVAGSGFVGADVDGGPATDVPLGPPIDLDVADDGSLYIATEEVPNFPGLDPVAPRVRRVAPDGTISTVYDQPVDAVAAGSGGDLLVAISLSGQVARVVDGSLVNLAGGGTGLRGDGGLATQATLSYPAALEFAADGSVLIGDNGDGRVREISGTGVVQTVAGGGWAGDGGPAIDACTESGPAVGYSMDAAGGRIYIGQEAPGALRRTDASGLIDTFNDEVMFIHAVAARGDGTAYVGSTGGRVWKVDPDGSVSLFAGGGSGGDGGPAADASLQFVSAIAVGPDDSVFLADQWAGNVRKVGPDGMISTLATGFESPVDVAVDGAGNAFVVSLDQVWKVTPGGQKTVFAGGGSGGDGGPATAAKLHNPRSVAVGVDGTVFLSEDGDLWQEPSVPPAIRAVDDNGMITTLATEIGGEVATDADQLYAAGRDGVFALDLGGEPVGVAPVFSVASPPGSGTVGVGYGPFQFVASGSPAPEFEVSSGALPDGLALSRSGVLSGTPTVAGAFTFTVAAVNVAGSDSSGELTITVGEAPPVGPPFWRGWDIARTVVAAPSGGGWTLDGFGGVHAWGGAPGLSGAPYWRGFDIARDLAVGAGGEGYVLDGWGGLHPVGGAPAVRGPYWRGFDIARKVVLNPAGEGGWVLDGWGGIHAFGGAPRLASSVYWRGWDIARDLVVSSDGRGGYLLDGWGGLHPVGDAAPVAGAPYWKGFDIARSVVLDPAGSGGWVLDGWGGVHAFGGAPTLSGAAYWKGWDIAKDLSVRGDGSGYQLDGWGGIHNIQRAT